MIRAARSLLPEVGLALGLFVALNVAGELLRPGFDQTGAWIDLPPGTAALAFKAALAGLPDAMIASVNARRRASFHIPESSAAAP